jgi:hypothetical protein
MAKSEAWFDKAADAMIRQGKSLAAVICDLAIPEITSLEARTIEANPKFQKCLWAARHKYYAEIANDPNRTKNAAIGQLVCIINKLVEQDKLKDAAEAILKLAKVQGWVGEGSTVNVFGNLTDRELREIEKKAEELERTSRKGARNPSEPLQ